MSSLPKRSGLACGGVVAASVLAAAFMTHSNIPSVFPAVASTVPTSQSEKDHKVAPQAPDKDDPKSAYNVLLGIMRNVNYPLSYK